MNRISEVCDIRLPSMRQDRGLRGEMVRDAEQSEIGTDLDFLNF